MRVALRYKLFTLFSLFSLFTLFSLFSLFTLFSLFSLFSLFTLIHFFTFCRLSDKSSSKDKCALHTLVRIKVSLPNNSYE